MRLKLLFLFMFVSLAAAHQIRIEIERERIDQQFLRRFHEISFLEPLTLSYVPEANTTIIPIQDYYAIMYTGRIRVGTPSQTFRVILDTGSADLWILSDRIVASRLSFLRYFACEKSTTCETEGTSWGIQYGLGRCEGVISRDVVSLGSLTANDQAFAEVTRATPNFMNPNQPMDGILGLGFRAGSSSQLPTLLDNLYKQGEISHKMFSFYLTSSSTLSEMLTESKGSELIIGPPDESLYKGQLFWTPVLYAGEPQMWFVKMEKLTVGDSALNICGFWQNPCVALPDTGTSFISLPASRWESVVGYITAGRTDCHMDFFRNVICMNGPQGLPPLIFQIDNHELVLTSTQYTLPNNQLAIQALAPQFANIDLFILGDPFLRAFYTVFDADGLRVGIANAKPLPKQLPWLMIAILSIAGCISACVCLDCLFLCSKRRDYQQILP